jgi:hypothetical protein
MFSWSGNKGSVLGGHSLYGPRGIDFWTQLKVRPFNRDRSLSPSSWSPDWRLRRHADDDVLLAGWGRARQQGDDGDADNEVAPPDLLLSLFSLCAAWAGAAVPPVSLSRVVCSSCPMRMHAPLPLVWLLRELPDVPARLGV